VAHGLLAGPPDAVALETPLKKKKKKKKKKKEGRFFSGCLNSVVTK